MIRGSMSFHDGSPIIHVVKYIGHTVRLSDQTYFHFQILCKFAQFSRENEHFLAAKNNNFYFYGKIIKKLETSHLILIFEKLPMKFLNWKYVWTDFLVPEKR